MHPVILLAALSLLAALPAAEIETIAGSGRPETKDGPALKAHLNSPFGLVRGPDGDLWFCEYDGHTVRRITEDGNVETVVGNGKAGYSGDGGPPFKATLNQPHEIRFDSFGDLYIIDKENHAVRKVDLKENRIETIAGTGKRGFGGDGGPATEALLDQPHSIQFGPDGRLYIADVRNHRIRVVDPKSGIIETLAGTGKPGRTPDGAEFAKAPLNGPRAIDFDSEGSLWLATREGNQVFKLDLAAGTIHHVVGTGRKGYSGDDGPAGEATLAGPKGISIGPDGRIWIADCENHAIRVIDPSSGFIRTAVGTGRKGDGPDGDPLKCKLARPHGIYVETNGNILIGDSENHRLRRLTPD